MTEVMEMEEVMEEVMEEDGGGGGCLSSVQRTTRLSDKWLLQMRACQAFC